MSRSKPTRKEILALGIGMVNSVAENEPQERRINPPALAALAADDLENFLVAATPGGIEAQEARGQMELCANSAKLPREGAERNRAQFEAIGIKFGANADDLFVHVELPDGWRIAPTEHSMWSKLKDVKGRDRASIFYKAAFYDRSAHINLCRRYSCGYRPVGGWEGSAGQKVAFEGYVSDGQTDLFVTAPTAIEPQFDRSALDVRREWMATRDEKGEEAEAWLTARYPDWQNPAAYWD